VRSIAAVPSAGAVLAFARNRPPVCSVGAAARVTRRSAAVAIPCQDPDGDALTYRLEGAPARGTVTGFRPGVAVYRGPAENLAPSQVAFSVRVSDGANEAVARVAADLEYIARAPLRIRILDARARMSSSGRVGVHVRCATTAAACRTRLALRRGRPLAFRSATLRSGRTRSVRLTLPARTRRAIRRHPRKGLLVTVRVTGRDGAGRNGRATRRIRVRAIRAP
jgi:hypothetical protein